MPCSDKPDGAWTWLNGAFTNESPSDELEEKQQDMGKFTRLDTKLSAALTRSAKGDLATKISISKVKSRRRESKLGVGESF